METNYCEIISNWEDEVGRVTVELKLSNDVDVIEAQEGRLAPDKIRTTTVQAIVDTGATLLVLPDPVLLQLGVHIRRTAHSRFADGRRAERKVYSPIGLEVQGRRVVVEALSGPDGVPALLGQVPLELLDFLVDSKNQRLIPNPESPDADIAMVDVY